MEISSLFSGVVIKDFKFSLNRVDSIKEIDNKLTIKINDTDELNNVIEEVSVTMKKQESVLKKINHFDYLIKKIDLIKSYSLQDPELMILLQAKIYCTKESFIIKSCNCDMLNQNEIRRKMKEFCYCQDLNIIFK